MWSALLDVLCITDPGNHTVRVRGAVIVLSFPHKLVQNDRVGGILDTCHYFRHRISPDEVPRRSWIEISCFTVLGQNGQNARSRISPDVLMLLHSPPKVAQNHFIEPV